MTRHKNLAFVFPGQGAQVEGMLKDLATQPIIAQTLEEANDALGYDLAQIILTGSKETLDRTEITQPALLTVSIALWRLWCEQTQIRPTLVAGHSLGEYSALVAADALVFSDAVRLVALRGRYMQEAVPEGTGAMAAILGLTDAEVIALCLEAANGEILAAVNFNSPGQIVIAGTKAAVERGCLLAKEKGAKRALPLPVSVPSHCALMLSASERLNKALQEISVRTPQIAVLHNVDVTKHATPQAIMEALTQQLFKPVRWTETIEAMAASGIATVVECGSGKVLTGLIKRIDKSLALHNVLDGVSLEATVAALGQA